MLLDSFNESLSLKLRIVIVVHRKPATCRINFCDSNIEVFNGEIDVVNFILSMIALYDLSFSSILVLESCYE